MKSKLYFRDGKIIAESGLVRVYEMDGDLFLEKGPSHFLWARASELKEYEAQIANYPKGDCLEIGLGLGISAEYILFSPNVKSLTTIEKDKDVIEVFFKLNPYGFANKGRYLANHSIVQGDGVDFLIGAKQTFDFIFLDFYSLIDEDTLPMIKLVAKLAHKKLNPYGNVVGWFDPSTPQEFIDDFFYTMLNVEKPEV
jgi:hypothetical protein